MAEEPDKGRAWLIAAAALIINIIISGIYRAEGLLFVRFINEFGVSRKEALMPFSIHSAVRNLIAPVIGILGQKYGPSAIIIVGGILGSLSSALCYFTADIIWITIIWGGLNGFSWALVNLLPQVVVTHYFIKYRTTATGLSWSGSSLSAFIIPAIFEFSLFSYGLQGTFLIMSCLIMHTIPAGMMLKEPPWLTNKKKQHIIDNVLQKCSTKQNEEILFKSYTLPLSNQINIPSINDKISDKYSEKKVGHDEKLKHYTTTVKRSNSQNEILHQVQMYKFQRSRSFSGPAVSSIEMKGRTLSSNPEYLFDVDIDYLKKHSELLFHMLSMAIPNEKTSCKASSLESVHDDLWHPDGNEMLQELENVYYHIEKSLKLGEISRMSEIPYGPNLKRTYFNGALPNSKKTESLTVVERHLKTYKERELRQLGRIRSAPNMCCIYNEIARKDYVISKLKQLSSVNDERIISHLCQFNRKSVLGVLFHLRKLYHLYTDVEYCKTAESNGQETTDAKNNYVFEKGSDSLNEKCSNTKEDEKVHVNSFKVHIKTALYLHTKPIFLLICFSRAAYFMAFYPILITLIDFAADKSLQIGEGKYLIAVMSFGDLFGRLCFGWITDRGYVSLSRYMVLGMTSLGISLIAIPLMYAKWAIFLSITIMGIMQGSVFVRHPVLVTNYLEPHEQSIAIGCSEFSCGILSVILPLYIGFFRDKLGFYDPMYFNNGVIAIICGLIWHLEPRIIKEK